ncbi:hypothetical protein [Gracilimonas sediminicola]|uniref:Uncharacterized protein n=1 Tax=Gracilimonas sediminicola TaxID=2952158 RepID=A0A9X2L0D1_9BACT|nr:hypothetical protein [Gracilimonas sediminicola]MCP9290026.1 hypothetical protein [Gracilimonas sediminicola]
MSELQLLHDRQRSVIQNFCNSIGCKDCPHQRFDEHGKHDGCISTDLQDKIMKLEFGDIMNPKPTTEQWQRFFKHHLPEVTVNPKQQKS